MTSLEVDGVLLDIEGTVSPIDFVYQTMFPFVRRELESFLEAQWDRADVQNACRRIAAEGRLSDFDRLIASGDDSAAAGALIRAEVVGLMDRDAKTTGLKELQGLIWRRGFESRELVAQLFDDVEPALRGWSAAGLKLYIYSSGSIAAQQLFFGHTAHGDLRPLLSGYFDTTTGPKRESSSYRAIADAVGISPARLVFLSDIPAELSAASSAGVQVILTLRPGNAPVDASVSYPRIERFSELALCR